MYRGGTSFFRNRTFALETLNVSAVTPFFTCNCSLRQGNLSSVSNCVFSVSRCSLASFSNFSDGNANFPASNFFSSLLSSSFPSNSLILNFVFFDFFVREEVVVEEEVEEEEEKVMGGRIDGGGRGGRGCSVLAELPSIANERGLLGFFSGLNCCSKLDEALFKSVVGMNCCSKFLLCLDTDEALFKSVVGMNCCSKSLLCVETDDASFEPVVVDSLSKLHCLDSVNLRL